jgi:predicted short-subunit dehydrogenase-like oxidoreductase (DUF2520 family)
VSGVKPDISILGAGRVGTSLGRALAASGHRIRGLACRRIASARESRRIIGQGRPLANLAQAAASGRIVILSLPADRLAAAALLLARAKVDWSGRIALHTSGLLPAEVLAPLRTAGAAVASFHPAQSFPEKGTPPARFRSISFGLDGDPAALAAARGLVRELGGYALIIPPEARPLYHAACTMAANYPVVLWQVAAELLERAGVEGPKAVRLIVPLAEGTLRNVKKLDPLEALTGPIARGDLAAVKAHLAAVARFSPAHLRLYRSIGLAALGAAARRGIDPGRLKALKRLLGGK